MKFLRIPTIAILILFGIGASADEGMWMIQDINEALEKNMQARGLQLSAGEIYNADAPGTSLSDAVVSLGFYCTGSVISSEGLIITNHHCAYSNIAKISTAEHNYLEDGFWAMSRDQEIPISGESVYFLKKVIDVTDEYKAAKKKNEDADFGEISLALEKKYSEETGLEAILSSMWEGEKEYISLYKVYTDLRLVAAPPVSIGYFGGEEDNWEWPRQNCDFAIYRIYENGVPVNCGKSLKISLKGYQPGSFTMVIGYPASTDRYASSYKISHLRDYILPASTHNQALRIAVMRKWMDADPDVRLKYSDWYFNLCNVQKSDEGLLKCIKRFYVAEERAAEEDKLEDWINRSDNRREMWKDLLPDLKVAYAEVNEREREKIIYRETLFMGTSIGLFCLRAANAKSLDKAKEYLSEGLNMTDPRVEQDLLEVALREYVENQESYYFGPCLKRLRRRFGNDYGAMSEYLWSNSFAALPARIKAFASMDDIRRDPLVKLFTDVSIDRFNTHYDELKKLAECQHLEKEYSRAAYWFKMHNDELLYPDANSTMRISYGTVGGYSPVDGMLYSWFTTPDGILEKYDPNDHDFNLSQRERDLLSRHDWGKWGWKENGHKTMHVDFLTDNDISGGNSGSPVLDADGNLIGLAFDGNTESLASDVSYTEGYNKCINTDIRFVLWTLDKYAGMSYLLKEFTFVK